MALSIAEVAERRASFQGLGSAVRKRGGDVSESLLLRRAGFGLKPERRPVIFPVMQLATQIAGVLGFLGVALGAFGAHQLAALLAANQTSSIWQTAVFYHLIHAVAALWAAGRHPSVVWLWAAGILVFSGSLYLLALTNVRWSAR